MQKEADDKLVEKDHQLVYNATLHEFGLNKNVCRSCMRYVILLIIAFVLIIKVTGGACFYFHLYVKGNYVNALSH